MKTYQYFTTKELACRCGCKLYNINDKFMTRIVKCRKFAINLCKRFKIDVSNAKFVVTSGCRCLEYNRKVSRTAPETSSHIASKEYSSHALDIAYSSEMQLLILIGTLFFRGGFTHIGIDVNRKYIHVDDQKRWLWFY
jgi:uncharacterized protein YcbK (DUF882 family)